MPRPGGGDPLLSRGIGPCGRLLAEREDQPSGREIRLLFVADLIPAELRRIVEFLNRQMDPAEVLAVEIRQYRGGGLRTLVPRVFGQTAEAIVKKSTGPRSNPSWTEERFFAALAERQGPEEAAVARRLLEWAQARSCRIWWGQGARDGSFFPLVDHQRQSHWTVAVWTYGSVEIQFQMLQTKPPFEAEAKRLELLERLNAIGEISIPSDRVGKRPNIPLRLLLQPEICARFLAALDWLVEEIRAS